MKYRTRIKHKKSEIEIFGLTIALNPDQADISNEDFAKNGGFCEFEVPDDRQDVIGRLAAIGEGFKCLDAPETQDTGAMVIKNADGESVDLSTLEKPALDELARGMEIKFHPMTGAVKMRAEIMKFVAGQ